MRIYGHPTENKQALEIWFDCCLGTEEDEGDILDELWVWAQKRGVLFKNPTGQYFVDWVSSGTKFLALWPTFVRWFLLCCREVTAARHPSPHSGLFEHMVELGFS